MTDNIEWTETPLSEVFDLLVGYDSDRGGNAERLSRRQRVQNSWARRPG
jgi:hypothetical protein